LQIGDGNPIGLSKHYRLGVDNNYEMVFNIVLRVRIDQQNQACLLFLDKDGKLSDLVMKY